MTYLTCGCSATQDALKHLDALRTDEGRCIGCGTPVDPPRLQPRVNFTDAVTEYDVTVRNPFKVF